MLELDKNTFYAIALAAGIGAIYYFAKKDGFINIARKIRASNSSATPFLDLYTTDFTQMASVGKLDPVIGREEEVRRLSQILSRRSKNNAILMGDPGVGKTAIVEGLAQRIVSGEVPNTLLNKRVLALDVATLMSGTKYRGEFEQRAKKIVQEISMSNRSIILFIDEIHAVVQSHGSEGAINFSDILKPALARGDLQMVGATTIDEYNKYIKIDSSLERRFQPIEIEEASEEEAIGILKGVKDRYRDYHKVEFTDAALEIAVKLTNKLIKDRKLPDKAIDAIDEAAAMVKVSNVHTAISAVLYQAAASKHPNIEKIWKDTQKIDSQISKTKNQKSISMLAKEREKLEEQLAKIGIIVVDSDDIEKVVNEWSD